MIPIRYQIVSRKFDTLAVSTDIFYLISEPHHKKSNFKIAFLGSENPWHQQMPTDDWPATSFHDLSKISPSPSLTPLHPFNPLAKAIPFGSSDNPEKERGKYGLSRQMISSSSAISSVQVSVTTVGTGMLPQSALSTTNSPTQLSPSLLFPRNKTLPSALEYPGSLIID